MNKSPILITGVGKRIGLALARNFLAQGLPVIGTYRTEYPELTELKEAGAELYCCDFQDDESVNTFITQVTTKHRSLRLVIHNASDWLPDDTDLDRGLDIIRKMMNVHVNIPYLMNLAFEPLLKEYAGQFADIIHITDYVAGTGSKKHVAYAASKAAAENLVVSFASKLAPCIKVNGISPALILFNEGDSAAYKEKALSKSLMTREGGLKEVVTAVQYLMDSEYVTGRVLHLDGGRHLKS